MIDTVATDAFYELWGRQTTEWTIELFKKLPTTNLVGLRAGNYMLFGETSEDLALATGDVPEVVGYNGLSHVLEIRTAQHIHCVATPKCKGQQYVHVMCRERGIIGSFIILADEREEPDFQPPARVVFETINTIGLGFLKAAMPRNGTRQYAFAAAAQPADMKGAAIVGCNGELSIFRPVPHGGPELLSCTEDGCLDTFASLEAACSHLEQVHGLPPKYWKCPEDDCGVRTAQPSQLQRHMHKHSESEPFVCGECGARFKWRKSADDHVDPLKKGWCPILQVGCVVPGCQAEDNVRSITTHLMLHHDYCHDCKHILTYTATDVITYGTLAMRTLHAQGCEDNIDAIVPYVGFKCDKGDCSCVEVLPGIMDTHMRGHVPCSWGCGWYYPVTHGKTEGRLRLAQQQHAVVCTGPGLDDMTRADILADVVFVRRHPCGLSNPPCQQTIHDLKKTETHLGAHVLCDGDGCIHRYPAASALKAQYIKFRAEKSTKGQPYYNMLESTMRELEQAHSVYCPSTRGSSPTPLHMLKNAPPAPLADPSLPSATPAGGHSIPSLLAELQPRSRVNRTHRGDKPNIAQT
ncbi:hypothetical protein LTR15_009516 [Elasticomyces elasticus]|nr:hypothetical protein LTR15_009516 [Elasticomyces elasticus]